MDLRLRSHQPRCTTKYYRNGLYALHQRLADYYNLYASDWSVDPLYTHVSADMQSDEARMQIEIKAFHYSCLLLSSFYNSDCPNRELLHHYLSGSIDH